MSGIPEYPPESALGADAVATAEDAVHRAARAAHSLVDLVADTTGPAFGRLLSGLTSATDALHDRVEDIDALQERWLEDVRDVIREHPFVSIGAGLAAGYLLSRLIEERVHGDS